MTLTESKSGWLVVIGQERAENIKMMQSPDRWPWAYRLPVKRSSNKTRTFEFGVLVASKLEPTVFGMSKRQGDVFEYDSYDAMLDDGWRVD